MMTIKPDEANRVLVIETHGIISEADVDEAFADLENRYPQVSVRLRGGTGSPIGVFVDWQHLTGWERGAKTLGTITGKTPRRRCSLGGDRGRREMARRSAENC